MNTLRLRGWVFAAGALFSVSAFSGCGLGNDSDSQAGQSPVQRVCPQENGGMYNPNGATSLALTGTTTPIPGIEILGQTTTQNQHTDHQKNTAQKHEAAVRADEEAHAKATALPEPCKNVVFDGEKVDLNPNKVFGEGGPMARLPRPSEEEGFTNPSPFSGLSGDGNGLENLGEGPSASERTENALKTLGDLKNLNSDSEENSAQEANQTSTCGTYTTMSGSSVPLRCPGGRSR